MYVLYYTLYVCSVVHSVCMAVVQSVCLAVLHCQQKILKVTAMSPAVCKSMIRVNALKTLPQSTVLAVESSYHRVETHPHIDFHFLFGFSSSLNLFYRALLKIGLYARVQSGTGTNK